MSFFNRSGWQTLKKSAEPSVSKDVRKRAQFMHCWWECKFIVILRSSLVICNKINMGKPSNSLNVSVLSQCSTIRIFIHCFPIQKQHLTEHLLYCLKLHYHIYSLPQPYKEGIFIHSFYRKGDNPRLRKVTQLALDVSVHRSGCHKELFPYAALLLIILLLILNMSFIESLLSARHLMDVSFNPFSSPEGSRVSSNPPAKVQQLAAGNSCQPTFVSLQNALHFATFPAHLVAYCLHLETLLALRSLLVYMSSDLLLGALWV